MHVASRGPEVTLRDFECKEKIDESEGIGTNMMWR